MGQISVEITLLPGSTLNENQHQRVWTLFRSITDHCDFIVTPTVLEIAPTHAIWDREGVSPDFSGIFVAMTAVANFLGWPAISVPAGFVDGMPVALQIIGRPDSEPGLLRVAQAFLDAQPFSREEDK